ncbi:vascular non-inflammatory molecule 3 [Nephila pilipes]|uniref:Vascular non-inflammatory molecule 3 n=1 Tax=Nephila pilipes TaxID=299642 RepID=A0A8X6TAI1_NEPPI|nr:vascular non-inflammatory molecule 3 [Nephila pilipes]
MRETSFAVFLALAIIGPTTVSSATDEYFTAAVYEFVQLYNWCPNNTQEAKDIVRKNLDSYIVAADIAGAKGADLIAYPEYGIFPECDRESTKMFLETIPDPLSVHVSPCDDPETYKDMPQLYTLSCIAKNHFMYVQANTGDVQLCEGKNMTQCPKDGHLQMNTNVVFDREGYLIARYHKEHLWDEGGMDISVEMQNPVFETDFGKFGSFVCLDVLLARIIDVIEEPEMDGIIFSTMWENSAPLFQSVQYFQGWAMGNNVTLIAADIQLAGQMAMGSGIFHSKEGALVYTFDPDGISKLLVARVPKRGHKLTEPKASITAITGNRTYEWRDDGENVPFITSHSLQEHLQDDLHISRYRQADLVNYTLVQLTEPKAHLTACNHRMCCTLKYSIANLTETFYFAIFNGTREIFPPLYWCEEDCMLVRCEPRDGKPCNDFPLWSENLFHRVSLHANFSTQFVYPSIISSHMRLVPRREWKYAVKRKSNGYKSYLNFHSKKGENLVAVGLKGRCYDRDSPDSFF